MAADTRNYGTFSQALDNANGGSYSDTLNRIVSGSREDREPNVDFTRVPSLDDGAIAIAEEDFETFNEATRGVKPGDSYALEDLGDHKMRYTGVLGDFEFDDREFQLCNIKDADGKETDTHILSYIGEEKNGKNIMIPNGIRDISYMFWNSDIESAPVIPDGVEIANSAFLDCHKLKEAKIDFPPSLWSGEFMFMNCENLKDGPRTIPGTVKYANYMLAECPSLQRTPKLGTGIEYMNGMFADCASLTEPPKIPGTVKESNYATVGCKGIDKEKDVQTQAKLEADKQAMENKLNHRSLGERMRSGVAAVFQCYAMHQRGYGLLMSMYQVHALRQSGQMGTHLRDGLAAVTQRHGPAGLLLASKLRQSAIKSDEKKAERNKNMMIDWVKSSQMHSLGLTENYHNMKKMSSNASKDVKNDLFGRYADMDSTERKVYRESHGMGGVLRGQEDILRSFEGIMDNSVRKDAANWYKERLADKVAYMTEAKLEIESKYTGAQKAKRLEGLELFKEETMQPFVNSVKKMQMQYGLFNDGDQRDIDRGLRALGLESIFDTDKTRQRTNNVEMQRDEFLAPVAVNRPVQPDRDRGGFVPLVPPVDLGPTRVSPPVFPDVPGIDKDQANKYRMELNAIIRDYDMFAKTDQFDQDHKIGRSDPAGDRSTREYINDSIDTLNTKDIREYLKLADVPVPKEMDDLLKKIEAQKENVKEESVTKPQPEVKEPAEHGSGRTFVNWSAQVEQKIKDVESQKVASEGKPAEQSVDNKPVSKVIEKPVVQTEQAPVKPEGWKSQIFKDVPSSGSSAPSVAGQVAKPAGSDSHTLTRDDKVRLAQGVSSDVKTAGEKTNDGPSY